ncbi:conserved hypothetical protein [Frankia sp. Hr75.2]|nr:conserved hypothetical protein [Frankia sp. Hr75.2]
MGTIAVSRRVTLKADPQTVWEFVRDLSRFAEWQPHIAAAEVRPNGDRLLQFKRGDSIIDRIVFYDEEARTYTYAIAPGQDTPLKAMGATFAVAGDPDGTTVQYTISVTVPDEMEELATKGITGDIDGALGGLDTKFNGGQDR